jgi:hypothetical protein
MNCFVPSRRWTARSSTPSTGATWRSYPLRGYGAIEIGVHRFHHPKAEDTQPVGEGRFVHVWRNKDGAWKITRVLSYDHHALPK